MKIIALILVSLLSMPAIHALEAADMLLKTRWAFPCNESSRSPQSYNEIPEIFSEVEPPATMCLTDFIRDMYNYNGIYKSNGMLWFIENLSNLKISMCKIDESACSQEDIIPKGPFLVNCLPCSSEKLSILMADVGGYYQTINYIYEVKIKLTDIVITIPIFFSPLRMGG